MNVDWKKVENDFMKRLDLNNDGKVCAQGDVVGPARPLRYCCRVCLPSDRKFEPTRRVLSGRRTT